MQLAFIGDVMLGRLVSRELRRREPASFWGDVGLLLRSVDATIANLECAITRGTERWERSPKAFLFAADPLAIEVLKVGNVRAVSLANNHILDGETAGMLETLRLLDEANIAHAGAGRDADAARRPAIFSAGPCKITLFACVNHEAAFAAGELHPGTALVDLADPAEKAFPSLEEIEAVRRNGVHLTVLSSHFGPNMVLTPAASIRTYRRAAARRGIDIIHGHSAHLFQGVERSNGSLILHDTGDILDDYAVDHDLHNDWSFVFIVDVSPDGRLSKLSLIPVILEFARVRLASRSEAGPMFERMATLSAAFGTMLVPARDRVALELNLAPVLSRPPEPMQSSHPAVQ